MQNTTKICTLVFVATIIFIIYSAIGEVDSISIDEKYKYQKQHSEIPGIATQQNYIDTIHRLSRKHSSVSRENIKLKEENKIMRQEIESIKELDISELPLNISVLDNQDKEVISLQITPIKRVPQSLSNYRMLKDSRESVSVISEGESKLTLHITDHVDSLGIHFESKETGRYEIHEFTHLLPKINNSIIMRISDNYRIRMQ